MSIKSGVKIFRITLFIIVLALIIGTIIYLFPVVKNLSTIEGQVAFKEKVDNSGVWGMLTLLSFQIAQIFLIIVPGEPLEILAGMCYGAIFGTIFIMVSACLISSIIFLLVRKYGTKFIYNFCDEEKVHKIENSKLFQNPKKIELIMLILFLIPGTPKDLLVYTAGLLPVKPVRFIIISTLARFPSVISSTLAGANFAMGNWKMSVAIYAIVFIIVGIIVSIIYKMDKEKSTIEALKTIK